MRKKIMIGVAIIIGLCIVVAVIGSLFREPTGQESAQIIQNTPTRPQESPTAVFRPTNTQAPTKTPDATPTATSEPQQADSACTQAPDPVREALLAGIHDIEPANGLGPIWAIKSPDFKAVWFVAAWVTGPGIPEPGTGPAVWAIGGEDLSHYGLILSANSFARQFSTYPDSGQTQAKITMDDQGARQVEKCAREK